MILYAFYANYPSSASKTRQGKQHLKVTSVLCVTSRDFLRHSHDVDVICRGIVKTIAPNFAITFAWVKSQPWYSQNYVPAVVTSYLSRYIYFAHRMLVMY